MVSGMVSILQQIGYPYQPWLYTSWIWNNLEAQIQDHYPQLDPANLPNMDWETYLITLTQSLENGGTIYHRKTRVKTKHKKKYEDRSEFQPLENIIPNPCKKTKAKTEKPDEEGYTKIKRQQSFEDGTANPRHLPPDHKHGCSSLATVNNKRPGPCCYHTA